MIDYPSNNVWLLIAEPLESLDDFEDIQDWGTLEENLLDDELEEEYE